MKTRHVPRAPLASAKILNGGHELSVHDLKRREDSFTLRYTIAPPLPDAADGTHTRGTVSAQPALAPKACEIRVRLTFLRNGEEHPCHLMLHTSATTA
ncbi:hypothetical protein SNOUR_02575 [Streptomyces noursei ATCC 11455]|uniref:hypothetical protein n=1 Tax=Streptomyces noursei TaxID=1971 RepID=UPI00081CFA09|nr:hypothetical protein SNOUR_02575 [Streptomyces noursei ATCC 11455]